MDNDVLLLKEQISKRIDNLGLDEFKLDLLKELKVHYKLDSFKTEDYSVLGNSRFGGFPDLPANIDYPFNEEGYYNLLCQVNFSDFKDKLGKIPKEGILYIFDGHSSEDDFKIFYSQSVENLETKRPPKGLENLNAEYRENVYDGIKVSFRLEHYFEGETIWDVFEYNQEKYNELIKTNSKFKSWILGNPHGGDVHAYLYLKGFDRLIYTTFLYEKSESGYDSNLKSLLEKSEKNLRNPKVNQDAAMKYRKQLLRFDQEKEEHLRNFKKVTCLLSLESLDELEWQWGDMGFKYLYILDEDLENKKFDNMMVDTWSS